MLLRYKGDHTTFVPWYKGLWFHLKMPRTSWSRKGKHNHVQEGWTFKKEPEAFSELQKSSWKDVKWKKSFGYLVYPHDYFRNKIIEQCKAAGDITRLKGNSLNKHKQN